MVITTTNFVPDKDVEKILGIVFGTEIYLVGGLIGGGLANQENLYSNAFRSASSKMESKARAMGADAVIAVSCNYTSPGGNNNMILVVTGTAVKLRDSVAGIEARKRAQEELQKKTEEAILQRKQQAAEAAERTKAARDSLGNVPEDLSETEIQLLSAIRGASEPLDSSEINSKLDSPLPVRFLAMYLLKLKERNLIEQTADGRYMSCE